MKTSLPLVWRTLFTFAVQRAVVALLAIFAFGATQAKAESSGCGSYTLDYTATYDAGTNKTTLLFKVSGQVVSGTGISHLNFKYCDDPASNPTLTSELNAGNYVAQYSTNGGATWNNGTISVGVDPSTSGCESGSVVKFNQGTTNGAPIWYRLVLNGNWTGTPDYVILKTGPSCCVAQLTNKCFKQECIKPTCTISGTSVIDEDQGGSWSVPNTPGQTYNWSISPAVSFTGQGTNAISVASFGTPGNYTISVTITISAGCSNTCTYPLEVRDRPEAFTITPSPYCENDEDKGSITVNGPEVGVTYCLYADGADESNQANAISCVTYAGPGALVFTNLEAGLYKVFASKGASQQVGATNNSQEVVKNPVPSLVISGVDVTCNGANNGSILLVVTYSGSESELSFSWTKDGQPFQPANTKSFSNLTPGVYAVTVTSEFNCSATRSVTIAEPRALTSDVTSVNVKCNGDDNGSIDLTVAGGTMPYTYAWTTADGTIPAGQEDDQDLSGLVAGTYKVTVTDANDCETTEEVTITQPAVLESSTSQVNVLCSGGNNGSIDLTVSGGTMPYKYAWTASNGGSIPAGQEDDQDLSGLVAGTYSVTVTDDNGCITTEEVTITVPNPLTSDVSSINVKCNGGNNGSIDLTVAGGTMPYTYAWTTANGTIPAGQEDDQDLSGLVAGTYKVTVTDANRCTTMEEVTITQPAVLESSTTQGNVLCNGGNTGSIDLTVSGGTMPYKYAWTASNGGSIPAGQADDQDLSGLVAGKYSVTVTDANDCETTEEVTITQPSAITASLTKMDVKCAGEANGSINLTASGGTGTLTYNWVASNGGSLTAAQVDDEDLSGLIAGTYTVTITDANSCSVQRNATITAPAALTCSVTASAKEVCAGGAISFTVSTTGGTGNKTYVWTVDGNQVNNPGNTLNIATAKQSGTYVVSVTVTDANGCTTTCRVSVPVVNCTVCTYTQGYYGNAGGKACFDDNPGFTTQKAIKNAITKPGYDGIANSEVFGLASTNRYFTLFLNDVVGAYDGTLVANPDNKKVGNNNIFKMLPGGGNSQAFGVLAGGASYLNMPSWSTVPMQTKSPNVGKIRNTLFAQTIPLYISLQNSKDLGGLSLQNNVVVTRDVECGTKNLVGAPMEYTLDASVIAFLQSNDGLNMGADKYPATVAGLYMLANAYLGGQTPGNLSIGAVANTVDKINNAFDGCRAAINWLSTPTTVSPLISSAAASQPSLSVARRLTDDGTEANVEQTAIKAFPNPFVDRVRFVITPPVSGQVQLDIVDATGRKLQTPFNGYLRAGQSQTVDVKIDAKTDGTLIYRMNMGGKQATGKLIRAKF